MHVHQTHANRQLADGNCVLCGQPAPLPTYKETDNMTLAAKDYDRTPRGIFRRKLDLSRRLQDASDTHRENDRMELSYLYHELAQETYVAAFENYRHSGDTK